MQAQGDSGSPVLQTVPQRHGSALGEAHREAQDEGADRKVAQGAHQGQEESVAFRFEVLGVGKCCASDDCRLRATPPSVVSGDRVYLGAVEVLVSALLHGANEKRVARLQELIVRRLEKPFGWVPLRLLASELLAEPSAEATLLYFFLCLVADQGR